MVKNPHFYCRGHRFDPWVKELRSYKLWVWPKMEKKKKKGDPSFRTLWSAKALVRVHLLHLTKAASSPSSVGVKLPIHMLVSVSKPAAQGTLPESGSVMELNRVHLSRERAS